jgi:hypothetical protein
MSGAAERGRGIWRSLNSDQRLAAGAAGALFVSMLLPWYRLTTIGGARAGEQITQSALAKFDFTEAAILIVASAVIALIVGRGEGGTFSLPGRDGTFVFAGGLWACLLMFFRVVSEADTETTTYGIAWGFFVAFLAALALAVAGWRMREHQPAAPPLVRDDAPPPPAHPRPRPAAAVGIDDTAPTLFDDIPGDDPEPPTRPMRSGEQPPA